METVIWILSCMLSIATLTECSWGEPGDGQYHIQTDEGPERYFRFQTHNGQYRKEKRLQDGTVIGTEAWIDADGYLRQKDYIADVEGYRILKSKTIFVGKERSIEDAITSTKNAPAQSGVLVDGSKGGNSIEVNSKHKNDGYFYSTTAIPATRRPTTTVSSFVPKGKLNYLSPAEAAQLQPTGQLGFDHYPDELLPNPNPKLIQRPHSTASLTINFDENQDDLNEVTSSPLNVPLPSLSMQPPMLNNYRRGRPISVVPPKPSPITANEVATNDIPSTKKPNHNSYSSPAPFRAPVVSGYYYTPQINAPFGLSQNDDHYQRAQLNEGTEYSTTATPSIAVPSIQINSLDGLQPPHFPTHYPRLQPVQSLEQSNTLENIDVPEYDGVSTTRNGFRYYLPRQYHEEENVGDNKRAGSFGYVDPFGIRRVVYYNASPGRGFVHRNNNRYVGLNARPYDPRLT